MEYWELWEIVLFNKVMERSYGMELGLLLHLAIQYTNVEKPGGLNCTLCIFVYSPLNLMIFRLKQAKLSSCEEVCTENL